MKPEFAIHYYEDTWRMGCWHVSQRGFLGFYYRIYSGRSFEDVEDWLKANAKVLSKQPIGYDSNGNRVGD